MSSFAKHCLQFSDGQKTQFDLHNLYDKYIAYKNGIGPKPSLVDGAVPSACENDSALWSKTYAGFPDPFEVSEGNVEEKRVSSSYPCRRSLGAKMCRVSLLGAPCRRTHDLLCVEAETASSEGRTTRADWVRYREMARTAAAQAMKLQAVSCGRNHCAGITSKGHLVVGFF